MFGLVLGGSPLGTGAFGSTADNSGTQTSNLSPSDASNCFPYKSSNVSDNLKANAPLADVLSLSSTTNSMAAPGYDVAGLVNSICGSNNSSTSSTGTTINPNNTTNTGTAVNTSNSGNDTGINCFPYRSSNVADNLKVNAPLSSSLSLNSNIDTIIKPGYDVAGLVNSICGSGSTTSNNGTTSNSNPILTVSPINTTGTTTTDASNGGLNIDTTGNLGIKQCAALGDIGYLA
jgi:hypothetical protein